MLPYLFDSIDFNKGEEIFNTPYTRVYKCTNKITNQDFIAKEILIYRENENAFKFLSSLNKLCEITDSNICPIYGYTLYNFERKPHQMILYPYYSNGSLDTFLSKKKLSLLQRAQICCNVADAISFLHERNIIHGSINLSNILVDFDNTPKLMPSFPKSEKPQNPKSFQDDYHDFALVAFKLFTYKKSDLSICEIPQEFENLIQRCLNIKNEFSTNNFSILQEFPFSKISKELKNAFKLPQNQKLVRKSIQKYGVEPGERNVEYLYLQGIVYLNDVPRQHGFVLYFIRAAAEAGHPRAMYKFAWMNLYGVGIEQNIETAINYYQKAANKNVPEAQLQYGYLLLMQNDQIKESINFLSLAYQNGNVEASVRLGIALEKMNYIDDAIKIYQFGVDHNDSEAQYRLGEIYESQSKFDEALELYKKSADQLNPLGQYNLALFYENGFGKHDRNIQLAFKYAKLAADQEHPTGLWYYGYLMETGNEEDRNYELIAKYYQRSASLNDPFGLWHYGSLLEVGKGVPQNLYEAAKCYKMSADLGNEFGQCAYGVMLELGLGGVTRNINEAEKYYKLSSKHINRDGLFHYGSLLERRNEIERATQYYRLAAKQNHPIALYRYAFYLENVKKDTVHALAYYYKASQFGNTDAMCCYAMLTEDEEDIPRYLKMAADLSNSEGQWRYGSYLLSRNNLKGAEKYFRLSAQSGNTEGEWRYAYVLEKLGRINESEEYYKRSSIKNNPKGKSNLGFLAQNGKIASDYITNYRSSATLGSDIGQFNYAIVHMNHQDNISTAERFFKLSADQNNAPALYNLSKIIETKDPILSAQYMKQAAKLGLTEAEVSYGLMLERGFGVKKDVGEAIKYYKLAAKKNDKNAQYNLALMLLNNADFKKAAILFKKSADQGHKLAALNLASMYEKGLGTDKDIENAFNYYQIAASSSESDNSSALPKMSFLLAQESSAGVPEAQFNLAVMYQNGNGVEQDFAQSYKFYKMASDSGLKQASYKLAVMLEQLRKDNQDMFNSVDDNNNDNNFGNSNEFDFNLNDNGNKNKLNLNDNSNFNQNPSKLNNDSFLNPYNCSDSDIVELYTKAADKNVSDAQFRLYQIYSKGLLGVDEDDKLAVSYLKRAADYGGNPKALFRYAVLLQTGISPNVSQNEEAAVVYYKRAIEAGSVLARVNLAAMIERGRGGLKKDEQSAAKMYKEAAELGCAVGMFNYAVTLENGSGIEKDLQLAKTFYEKAAKQGYREAQERLNELNEAN